MTWAWSSVATSMGVQDYIALWNQRAALLAGEVKQKQSDLGYVNLGDWIDTTGARDGTARLRQALNTLTSGGIVTGPPGALYNITDEIVIPYSGIVFDLPGGSNPLGGPWPTNFVFTLANGKNCFSSSGKRGLKFKGFNVTCNAGTGGKAIQVLDASMITCEDLVITHQRGTTGGGIQYGDLANTPNAVIASSIRNCTIAANGTPVLIGQSCTTTKVWTTYAQVASGGAAFHFYKSTGCGVDSCGADSGTDGSYAYKFEGVIGGSETDCDAEGNSGGHTFITGSSQGVRVVSPIGVQNNQQGSAAIGSLVEISGGTNRGIKIDTAIDLNPHASTTVNIRGGANTKKTTIINYDSTMLPLGYTAGSDATWLLGGPNGLVVV